MLVNWNGFIVAKSVGADLSDNLLRKLKESKLLFRDYAWGLVLADGIEISTKDQSLQETQYV